MPNFRLQDVESCKRFFPVTFLGVLSDFFRGCWWPPYGLSKGHLEEAGMELENIIVLLIFGFNCQISLEFSSLSFFEKRYHCLTRIFFWFETELKGHLGHLRNTSSSGFVFFEPPKQLKNLGPLLRPFASCCRFRVSKEGRKIAWWEVSNKINGEVERKNHLW